MSLNNQTILIVEDSEDILDLMDKNLPGAERSLYISKQCQEGYNQPVIYVSIKDASDEIVEGFDRGGDDYINKQLKTVNVAIKRLKETINPTGEKNYIQAVRGEGHIFC